MYQGSMTKLADAALASQHLLVKVGSDADHFAIAGVADDPVGTVPDKPAAAEVSCAVRLLGSFPGSVTMVASEAMATTNVRVFAAAAGKISLLPGDAGTYKCVGKLLTVAAGDGSEVEVDSCIPFDVVVTG